MNGIMNITKKVMKLIIATIVAVANIVMNRNIEDRRKSNTAVAAIGAYENATGKIAKFSNVTSNIVDIVDISLVNHPVKFDIKIICVLQTKMIKTA